MKWGFDFCTSVCWGGGRFDQLLVTFTNSWSFYQLLVVFTNFGHFLVTTMPRVYKAKGLRQTDRTNLEKAFYHRLQANYSVRKAATQYQVATMIYRYMSKDLLLLISLYFLIQVILARYYNFKWQLITYLY